MIEILAIILVGIILGFYTNLKSSSYKSLEGFSNIIMVLLLLTILALITTNELILSRFGDYALQIFILVSFTILGSIIGIFIFQNFRGRTI